MNGKRMNAVFGIVISVLALVVVALYVEVENKNEYNQDLRSQVETAEAHNALALTPQAPPTPDQSTPISRETIESMIQVSTPDATPSHLFLVGGNYCLADRAVIAPLETGGLSVRFGGSGTVEFVSLGDGSKSMISFEINVVEENEHNYFGEFEENDSGYFGWVYTNDLSVCQ